MQRTGMNLGNIRQDDPSTDCGFHPDQAARDQRQAMREAVGNIDSLRQQFEADDLARKAIEDEYTQTQAKLGELFPRMIAAQQKAGRSGEAYGRALAAKQKLTREQQVGLV